MTLVRAQLSKGSGENRLKNRIFSMILGSLAVFAGSLSGCAGRTVDTGDQPAVRAPAEETRASSPRRKVMFKNVEASADYHFSLAQAYAADGSPDRAIEEYRLALAYDARSPLIHARMAGEYVKKGMLSSALESCQEALKLDADFVDARLLLAGLYSTTKETSKAVAEYDRILKKNPKHEEAAVYKGIVLSEDGKLTAAVAHLRAFVSKKSDSALTWYHIGRFEQQLDNFKGAVAAFKKAIEVRPGFTQATLALGVLYEENHRSAEALKVYEELYNDQQDPGAANRLSTIYLKNEQYEKALPYLETLAHEDPEDMNVRVKLGLVQMQMKRYPAAVATFNEILKRHPESDRVLYYLGSLHEEQQEFPEAIAALKKINVESKMYSDAVLHVAFLLKKLGRPDEAKAFMAESIQKSPRVAAFYVFQASVEEENKRVPAAIKVLEDAVERFPEDEKVRYYLGSLYDREGDSEKGLSQMEEILKTNPDNVDALNYIGYTWTSKGIRLNDAEKLLKRAMSLRPDNGFITDSWGWYLFTRGKTKEAIVALETAVKLKPDEATILEHLADAYARYNLREKALEQYAAAMRLAQESGDTDTQNKIQLKAQNIARELGITPNLSKPSDQTEMASGDAPADASAGSRKPASTR